MKLLKKWSTLIVAIALLIIIAVLSIVGISSIRYYKNTADEALNSKLQMETSLNNIGGLIDCYVVNQTVRVGDEITEENLTPIQIPEKVAYMTREVEVEVEDENGKKTTEVQQEKVLSVVDNINDVIGKKFRVDMAEGAILLNDYVMDENLDNTARFYELVLNNYPTTIQVGDYVDIRIEFTYGEDFIALPHKRVVDLDLNNNMFTFVFDEHDINTYNSMLLDKALFESVQIYAVKYVDTSAQTAAESYYPINGNISDILNVNPNILDLVKEQMKLERKQLDDIMGGNIDSKTEREVTLIQNNINQFRKEANKAVSSAIKQRVKDEQAAARAAARGK